MMQEECYDSRSERGRGESPGRKTNICSVWPFVNGLRYLR